MLVSHTLNYSIFSQTELFGLTQTDCRESRESLDPIRWENNATLVSGLECSWQKKIPYSQHIFHTAGLAEYSWHGSYLIWMPHSQLYKCDLWKYSLDSPSNHSGKSTNLYFSIETCCPSMSSAVKSYIEGSFFFMSFALPSAVDCN